MSFEIPRKEVVRMKPEGFVGTYTCSGDWIQHNKRVTSMGSVRGLVVFESGNNSGAGFWGYDFRDHPNISHYRSLEDLVQGCGNEELLGLFLKKHCQ